MKKIFTLIVCLYCWALSGHAQTNFQPGLVVTPAGDTLRGFINHKEWLRNPEEITFKTNLSTSTEQAFTPTNSRYVEVNGEEAYTTERVRISLAPVELSQLSDGVDTTTTVDTVFLKVIHNGPIVSLYSYRDNLKERFYIKESQTGTSAYELLYRRYYVAGKTYQTRTDEIFKNQIYTFAFKNGTANPAFKRRVERTRYVSQDILPLIVQLNGPEAKSTATSFNKNPRTRFIAGLWLNKAVMSQSGDSRLANGAKETASLLPKVSIGLDAFANPNTQRLIFRTELSASAAKLKLNKTIKLYSTSAATQSYEYELEQLSISFNPQILYNLYNTEKLKIYVAPGLMTTLASYSKDRFSSIYSTTPGQTTTSHTLEDYETPQTFWYTYSARVGITLFNKLDMSLLYTSSDISKRINYSIDVESISFGLNYLFNRKQVK